MLEEGTLRLQGSEWYVDYIRVRPVYHTTSEKSIRIYPTQLPHVIDRLVDGDKIYFMLVIDGQEFFAQIKMYNDGSECTY